MTIEKERYKLNCLSRPKLGDGIQIGYSKRGKPLPYIRCVGCGKYISTNVNYCPKCGTRKV